MKEQSSNINEQNQNIVLDKGVMELLEKLSKESQMSSTQLLAAFIKREDSDRHIKWSRKDQKMVRVNCGLKRCWESRPYDAQDLAD